MLATSSLWQPVRSDEWMVALSLAREYRCFGCRGSSHRFFLVTHLLTSLYCIPATRPHRKISGIGVSRPPVAQAIRVVVFCVECACASKTLNAGKIRVNGTTTLWEVLVSVCDVLSSYCED